MTKRSETKKDNKDRDVLRLTDLAYIAAGTVLIAVCSWITVPGAVPFTLQTFGIFLILHVLGGKRSMVSVFLYIFLGVIGVPVFSGFGAGPGVLLGPTGGYIAGFVLICGIYWLALSLFGKKLLVRIISQIAGLFICYIFGTLWFVKVYVQGGGDATFGFAFMTCVLPFIIPDIIKMALSAGCFKLLSKALPDMPGM